MALDFGAKFFLYLFCSMVELEPKFQVDKLYFLFVNYFL